MSCAHTDCTYEALENDEYCALHVKKKNYSANYADGVLSKFNKALIEYIIDSFFEDKPESNHFTKDNIRKLLSHGKDSNNAISNDLKHLINDEINNMSCYLSNIKFPDRDERDYFDYYKVLNKLPRLWFNDCSFTSLSLSELHKPSFYDGCVFSGYVYLSDAQVLPNVSSSLFQFCVFESEVEFYPDIGEHELSCNYFHGCQLKKLSIHRALVSGELIREERDAGENAFCLINELNFENVVFNNKFTLNSGETSLINLVNTTFEDKVEIKKAEIVELNIDNCNFKKVTDLYGSKIKHILMHKCIIHDFIGFESCVFGGDSPSDIIASYKYVTFLDFVNFRNSVFNGGLDFKYSNTKIEPNFLDSKLNEKQTDRQTFRIIKHSFDSVSNYIDANRYYALEMQRYCDDVSFFNSPFTKIMLLINKYTSNFGQSYMRPLVWLLAFLFLFMFIFIGHEQNLLYQLPQSLNDNIQSIAKSLNSFANSVLLLKKFYIQGMEFICLLFIAIYSSLIYQFVVALRRLTKR